MERPLLALIGHEGRLSNLLTELAGARHRPFPEAGAVCVAAGSVQDLLRGDGRVEFRLPVADHQEAELRAKVDSKKTVAALLAGFVLSALVGVLVEGPKPAERDFADDLTIVSFSTALAFFVAAFTSTTSWRCQRASGRTGRAAGRARGSRTRRPGGASAGGSAC